MIEAGHKTDTHFQPVKVCEVGSFLSSHPGWTVELRVTKPKSTGYYVPGDTEIIDGVLYWTPDETDTEFAGVGEAQVWARDGEGAKGAICDKIDVLFKKGLSETPIEIPAPMQAYFDAVLSEAAKIRIVSEQVNQASDAALAAQISAAESAASVKGFVESAEKSAIQANASKNDALTASNNAFKSATSAENYAEHAATSFDKAKTAQTAAESARDAARNAQNAAESAKSTVSASADAAARNAANAALSARDSATNALDAKRSADAAKADAASVAVAVRDGISEIKSQAGQSVQSVRTQETESVEHIVTAKQIGEQAVQAKTEEQLARIPEVTQLVDAVDSVQTTLDQHTEDIAAIQAADSRQDVEIDNVKGDVSVALGAAQDVPVEWAQGGLYPSGAGGIVSSTNRIRTGFIDQRVGKRILVKPNGQQIYWLQYTSAETDGYTHVNGGWVTDDVLLPTGDYWYRIMAANIGGTGAITPADAMSQIQMVSDLSADVAALKDDYAQLKNLLQQVRDALAGGDIDEAINLLDTFLLDEGVLV